MKRIFIAVGSESIKGVRALIKRLCEENLFNRFDDLYVAIDSDVEKIAAFNALGVRLRTSRVKGRRLEIGALDEAGKEILQSEWTAREVPAGGVGGDRNISAKAMTMIRDLWNDPELALLNGLAVDDEIFVIGSAFGGTAGGTFLNVCEYLDLQIRAKRNANPTFVNVKVSGFLLMPEAVVSEGQYPIANNMIDMFRDLQTTSWRRRLESERAGFKVPVWGHFNGNEFELFNRVAPGTHMVMDYGIQGSSLPMSSLYVVPTPQGKRHYHSDILAESLFAAAYLNVDAGFTNLVNRQIRGGLGMRDNIGVEDDCLCGFNMFAMKSGRLVSLKNWFWRSLMEAVKGSNGRSGLLGDDAEHPVIPKNIIDVFRRVQTPERDDAYAGVSPDNCIPLKTLLERVHDAMVSPRAMVEFSTQFKSYLDSLKATVPAYRAIPAKELIVLLSASPHSGWNREMNFSMIRKGYAAFYREVLSQKANREMYVGELLGALDKAIKLVNARRKHRVVRNWCFGLSQEESVFTEITDAFKAKFKALLRNYIYACRCEKTALQDEAGFERELIEYRDECNRWFGLLREKCEGLRGEGNPYIIDGNLVEPLKPLPDAEREKLAFDPLRTVMSVVYRSCVTAPAANETTVRDLAVLGDNGAMLCNASASADGLLQDAEEAVINRYIELAENLLPGVNPLTDATLADFAAAKLSPTGCHPFCDDLKVRDSNTYHYHFVIQQGNAPASFRLTNDDVSNVPLGLKTMPGTSNGSGEFLAHNHSAVLDTSYWKDAHTVASPMFKGLHDPGKPTQVNGLWLGTLGIDFTVRQTLERLYSFAPNVTLAWVRAGLMAPAPRRAMTLVETVRFGVVMEAVESALKDAWAQHKRQPGLEQDTVLLNADEIRFAIEKPGCRFEFPAARLVDCGIVDDADGSCSFETLTVEWTKRILAWIRTKTANGFESFFPTVQFTSMLNAETNIFQNMRFSITAEEIREIDTAKEIIKNCVTISGL
ncbi:MAG: tubulin-like doman-containing protein [Kiritimatiellae bacterium]|nr:tubulin-like doman-containing protein [Kiritimatiellia bacterium]